jgi:Raf kinase inhibitor-like YbhB/YbcL family protein
MHIVMKSSAFPNGGSIPAKYTCDGEDISPPIEWGPLPPGTVTIALIVDDPDAPRGTWVHWVVYNIPSEDRWLPEDIPNQPIQPDCCLQGLNDFRRIGYGGPCPPGGVHRYFFKLYALNVKLDLAPGSTKAQLLEAMEGHIIGTGEYIGTYSRS